VRANALVAGWKKACDTCRVAWGGGETPALAGIVADGRVDLAASCTGIVSPKSRLSLGDKLGAGDAIVFLAASGIHANGLSLARKLAERLPQGYLTDIGNGQTYGDALLAPTALYSPVTEALAAAGIVPHYSANVTGHGWRKLMRHPKALTYRITAVPPKTAVLDFMQRECQLDDHEAYGTLNMGAGFALYLADADEANHLMTGLDFGDATHQDLRGAVDFLAQRGQPVGVTGFCMGGALTVAAAVHLQGISAAVCFYGIPPAEFADPAQIRIPFQGHFATQDGWCTPAAVAQLESAMKAAGQSPDLHHYEADHAFVNKTRPEVYNEACATLAWNRTVTFLQQYLHK
jgi:dienelactone hydrolase